MSILAIYTSDRYRNTHRKMNTEQWMDVNEGRTEI